MPKCRKKRYETLEDAQKQLRKIKQNRLNDHREQRAYCCPICFGFHLTSLTKEEFQAQGRFV